MKSLYVSEQHVRNIFNSLAIKEESRTVLNNLVVRFDYSYTNFVYSLFSAYTKAYVSVLDEGSGLTQNEIKHTIHKLMTVKRDINPSNIFVADKYDVLYGISYNGNISNMKFKDYLYEDMYSRLENLLGVEHASDYMEDIFESIEFITSVIEGSLLSIADDVEDTICNLLFYLDIQQEGLLFIII